ncbi:unnamed protein product [Periconia digitata]|uniref:Letm1 RBD domain-containing protein n=1 Tax=Periconia digitata TaxID=1303443 RepID=A0A9W4UQ59_9PLEO|nr:unnamed protein product [Periconia digitata]
MKPRPVITTSVFLPRRPITCRFSQFQNRRAILPSLSTAPYSTLESHNHSHGTASISSPRTRLTTIPSRRHASSSSSVPAKSPSPSPSPPKVPLPQALAKLNPPEDTYAPELTIPSKQPGQNSFKYLFQCGKLYIQFYKKGIANVRSTSKLAKSLRKKQKQQQQQQSSRMTSSTDAQGGRGNDTGVLTRAEWQITRRSRTDMLRLPPFAVLVLILGEWMPLVALYLTPIIPEPCRIPRQVERMLRKSEERRTERLRRIGLEAARLVARDRRPGTPSTSSTPRSPDDVLRASGVRATNVDDMDLYTLLSLSARLDLHGWTWDRLFVTPPKSWLKRLVGKRLEYLKTDDALIVRDGGYQVLGELELRRACYERGMIVLGVKEYLLRRALADWFRK